MDADLRFRETSRHTTDDKGRIVLPTRFRDVVEASGQDRIFLSRMEQALVGYTLQGWRVVEEKIANMPVDSNATRQLKRFFLGASQACECNKQGRVLIPAALRDFAGIGSRQEIVLVGMLDHFEIWSRERYDKEYGNYQETIASGGMGKELAKLGL